ncbi:MAG: DUF5672 family protein [Pedobacter agri]
MSEVIVTVPLYKEIPSNEEKMSFLQLLKVLGQHPIAIVTHKELDLSQYIELAEEKTLKIEYFPSTFFSNIEGYSKLLCAKAFYKRFEKYKFLLIYQLDAWVFRDELDFWCNLNHDYIGAPWFYEHNKKNALETFYGVGNGGFSLRKISSHLKALNHFYQLESYNAILRDFLTSRIGYIAIKNLFYNLTVRNFSHYMFNQHVIINEDVFWNLISKRNFKWYTVPDMITAGKFSSEINASLLFEANNRVLPFGCHAWQVYDRNFWKQFIET